MTAADYIAAQLAPLRRPMDQESRIVTFCAAGLDGTETLVLYLFAANMRSWMAVPVSRTVWS